MNPGGRNRDRQRRRGGHRVAVFPFVGDNEHGGIVVGSLHVFLSRTSFDAAALVIPSATPTHKRINKPF